MKVYLVYDEGLFNNDQVQEVFLDEEKAKAYLAEICGLRIEEHEVIE